MLLQGTLPFPVFTAFHPYLGPPCMGSYRPCRDICVLMCVCGTETAVAEPKGSCLNLCTSTHFLMCGRRFLGFFSVRWGTRGLWRLKEAVPECSKPRFNF